LRKTLRTAGWIVLVSYTRQRYKRAKRCQESEDLSRLADAAAPFQNSDTANLEVFLARE
jgi:hypothetical protein